MLSGVPGVFSEQATTGVADHHGRGAFSAADTDLDGRVEIWTDDAAAINGFEGLSLAELDSAPTVVLRFSANKLVDVSPEFQPYYDREIASLEGKLQHDDLCDFKNREGALLVKESRSAERQHNLRRVKAEVLEIVWSYLYSGRERQAWQSLEKMWPASDIDRIRAAILAARARGIAAQTDGVSRAPSGKRKKRVVVFDAIGKLSGNQTEVVPPEPIMLIRPSPTGTPDQHSDKRECLLNLVIDSEGKVRSAEVDIVDPTLVHATAEWKFIPAFKQGRAVACKTRLSVSPKQ